jgi:hypothetical protein
MQNVETLRPEQIREFLRGSRAIQFAGQNGAAVYAWISETLGRQEYLRQGKKGRALVRQDLGRVTGKNRAQATRLIRQRAQTREVRWAGRQRARQTRPSSAVLNHSAAMLQVTSDN